MNIIVTVDSRWGLTWNHQPLVRIPSEYRMIQNVTEGKVVVMDYDTLRSFPGEKVIGGRTNIVLRRGGRPVDPGVITISDLEALDEELKKYESDDVYLCGGIMIYERYLNQCKKAYVTWVDYEYRADVYFPNLDSDREWELSAESEEKTYYDLEYYVREYDRK